MIYIYLLSIYVILNYGISVLKYEFSLNYTKNLDNVQLLILIVWLFFKFWNIKKYMFWIKQGVTDNYAFIYTKTNKKENDNDK